MNPCCFHFMSHWSYSTVAAKVDSDAFKRRWILSTSGSLLFKRVVVVLRFSYGWEKVGLLIYLVFY